MDSEQGKFPNKVFVHLTRQISRLKIGELLRYVPKAETEDLGVSFSTRKEITRTGSLSTPEDLVGGTSKEVKV